MTAPLTITVGNLGNLVYAPALNANGAARSTFGFRANDSSLGTVAATMTINVGTTNDAPTDIALSNNIVGQGAGANAVVGNLTATDIDGPSATFTFASGAGSTDNGSFNLLGNQLRATNPALMTPGAKSIRVNVADGAGGNFEKIMTVTVAGVIVAHSGVTTIVSEAGLTDTVTVVLSAPPSGANTVTVAVSGAPQLSSSSPSVVFNSSNWNIAQTLTISAIDDPVVEGSHSGTLTFTTTSGDVNFQGIANQTLSATIGDNDTAGISVTQSGGTTNITENGPTDTISVVLLSQPSGNVTITLDPDTESFLTGNTADVGVPLVLTFTPALWNVPQVVTVTADDDSFSEGPHTSTISFTSVSSDPLYNNVSIPNVVAAVTDDDNSPPMVNSDTYSMFSNTTLTVNTIGPKGLGILANDTDSDSSVLSVVTSDPQFLADVAAINAFHGPTALVVNGNGSFTFTPLPGFNGPVSFTYLASDGISDSFPVYASVTINVINLFGANPIISGTPNADTFLLRLRPDGVNLEVLLNSVVVLGADPVPVPLSSLASVSLLGIGGDDTFTIDFVNGQPIPPGGINVDGGLGTDAVNVVGDPTDLIGKNVTVTETAITGLGGGVINDVNLAAVETLAASLTGGADTVNIDMDNTNNELTTATINAGGGNDLFNSLAVANLTTLNLFGAAGDDSFGSSGIRFVPSATTRVVMSGEAVATGTNTSAAPGDSVFLDVSSLGIAIADMAGGNILSLATMPMSFNGIEFGDLMDRNAPTAIPIGEMYLRGSAANETATFFVDGPGTIGLQLYSNAISRRYGKFGLPTQITSIGDAGNDTLGSYVAIPQRLFGEAGNDTLTGGSAADFLIGGADGDYIVAGDGSDTIFGDSVPTVLGERDTGGASAGADRIYGGNGDDLAFGGGGDDQLNGDGGNDYLHGGLGNDTFTGGDGTWNLIRGQGGNDAIYGGNFSDILLGGDGNDVLSGQYGRDFLLGGDGVDTISDGNDTLQDLYSTEMLLIDADNATPAQMLGMSSNDLSLIAQLTAWQTAADDTARIAIAASIRTGATNDGDGDKTNGATTSWDYAIYSTGTLLKNAGGDQLDLVV